MYFPTRSAASGITLEHYGQLDFSAPVRQWVGRFVDMARGNVVPAPVLGAARRIGAEAVASVCNTHYASAFAALENAGGLVYALKPAQGDHSDEGSALLRTAADDGWFSIGGVPVMLFPDESKHAVDSGRFTVSVAFLRNPASPENGLVAGLLGVAYSRDLQGVDWYEIVEFTQSDNGYNAVAERSQVLPPGTRLMPMGTA